MLALRLVKTVMVASFALFALLYAWDNIANYTANLQFVRHTLSMDTVFPDNPLKDRAITSPTVWALAFWAIILTEAVIGLVLAYAAVQLARNARAPAAAFNAAKQYVVLGVGLGFLLWFTGFMVGGEWFQMGQSKDWNTMPAAFWFYMTLLGIGIFVCMNDGELKA